MELSRRLFMKGALGLAVAGLAGASAVPALKSLLPPPVIDCDPNAAHDTLTYRARGGEWYASRDGEAARKEDFEQAYLSAIVDWAPAEMEAELGICENQLTLMKLPTAAGMAEWGVPDEGGSVMMMAFHTFKCTHLCCKPEFIARGEGLSGPFTDSLFCACHQSRWDPLSIVADTDEKGRGVMAAKLLEGPAPYGLPIIPLAERDGVLVGRTDKLVWLKYCGLG